MKENLGNYKINTFNDFYYVKFLEISVPNLSQIETQIIEVSVYNWNLYHTKFPNERPYD